jgi:hypothetical protein
MLQRFCGLDVGTNNVTVPNLESELPIIQGLLLDRTDAFLKHPHLFDSIEVIEDDPLVALDDNYLAGLIGIGPANVDVS